VELYIPLGDLVDKDEELAKLNKRLSELDSFILSIENKLSNDDFISKAPKNIVRGEKNKLNDFLVERTKILSNIEVLK
jgi:valyl-tRNA synthetase